MGELITLFTRQQLEQQLDDIIEMGDDNSFDMVIGAAAQGATRQEMMADYIATLNRWYFHLKNYTDQEDYELCAKLVQVIKVEELNYIGVMKQFCTWYSKEDKKLMKEINLEMRDLYNI